MRIGKNNKSQNSAMSMMAHNYKRGPVLVGSTKRPIRVVMVMMMMLCALSCQQQPALCFATDFVARPSRLTAAAAYSSPARTTAAAAAGARKTKHGRSSSRRPLRSIGASRGTVVPSEDDDGHESIEPPKGDDNGGLSLSTRGGGGFSLPFGTKQNTAPLPSMWPQFDALDNRIYTIAWPVICNFAISPLVGAIDLFWVNYLTKNPLAVAGQAAANQVFGSVFWLTSFLPNVTAMLISTASASGDDLAVQDAVAQALLVGILFAAASSAILLAWPDAVLSSVLSNDAPALLYARPYLLVRAFAFVPSIISLVGFSAFRGVLDTKTPVKISLLANAFHTVLDPLLIANAGWGVTGAAVATLTAEVVSAVIYLKLLVQKGMLARAIPSFKLQPLKDLLSGGAALQLRNVALNVAFLAVARVTQSIDQTGVSASAHAMAIQVFQVGGIFLLGLSMVAQTVVPNDLVVKYDRTTRTRIGGRRYAKATVNRLMSWGLILGSVLGSLQVALLPLLQSGTPVPAVRAAARNPALLASLYQVINGLVFIGEGVMIGTGSFLQLSLSTIVATVGLLWALKTFPPVYGLTGVWYGFGVFNILRLAGVIVHQCVNGPLSPRKLQAADDATKK
jgi:putative MATE family efflux protein